MRLTMVGEKRELFGLSRERKKKKKKKLKKEEEAVATGTRMALDSHWTVLKADATLVRFCTLELT
jgi:hypothetical protein